MTSKWMGSAITAITFLYFLTDMERYNPLDYFGMGTIEEIRFHGKIYGTVYLEPFSKAHLGLS